MVLQVPEPALAFGFTNGPGGTHTSRTMMLAELRLLLAACPRDATFEDYQVAIIDDNVLLKNTLTTRVRTRRGLRELYALNRKILLFRALRDLWDDDPEAQPLLGLVCAIARDPVLRATTEVLLGVPPGKEVTSQMMEEAVARNFPSRYNAAILAKIGRNAASTWEQAGHLQGRLRKIRVRAESRPAAVAYALLLGYLCGGRGEALFHTLWSRLLDTPPHVLHEQAFVASQRGWIEYRRTGEVTDIGFRYLLRQEGRGDQE